jgi:purine catabolism regulator
MDIPTFQGARIVAGLDGIGREVKNVTVAEVPDAADWLRGGELVLTTGFFIRENDEFQKNWMKSLIERGAAALAIKPERFFGATPELMKSVSNEHAFPLIELPFNVTWPMIMESVMNKINDNQSRIIKKTEEIHNRLTKIVLEGRGLSYIAGTLAQLVDNVIIVEDVTMGHLAIGSPNRSQKEIEDLLSYRLSKDYSKEFMATDFYRNSIRDCKKDLLRQTIGADKTVTQITMPIVADQTIYGFVNLVEFFKPASEIDIIALEHGATTIALEMMKEKIAYETEKRLKRNFLDDLLDGRIEDEISLTDKYNFISFDVTKPSIVILLELCGADSLTPFNMYNGKRVFLKEQDNQTTKIIESVVNKSDPKAFIYNENSRYVILYHFAINKEKSEILKEVRKLCEKVSRKIVEAYPGASYYFGIGGIYYQISNLKRSYSEAKKALDIGELFIGKNQIFVYNELGIYRLLFMIEKKDELLDFCNDTIGDLIKYDSEKKDNLCNILERFLLNNGNIAETSRDLFLHPNTLAYRLKKISNILNKDLSDAKTRYNLYFALTIKKVYLDN